MPIDKKAIHTDLIAAFIVYQWRLDNPWPKPEERSEAMRAKPKPEERSEAMRAKYLNDPMFHAKVESLVCGVMSILDKHI